jgi:N utilization substance protein A
MKLDAKTIANITLIESITGAAVKDVFEDDNIINIIVEEGNVKKALGYENKNLKKIQYLLKKNIKIIGFSNNPERFINNLLYPIKTKKVEIRDKIMHITAQDTLTKGKIFGRSKENLKKIKEIVTKYFDVTDVAIL